MEMSSTTQRPWASASNYFKGALTLPSSPWKLSSFPEKEMCHSSPRTGKDTPSHSEVSSASREAFAVQEPGKTPGRPNVSHSFYSYPLGGRTPKN